MVEDDMKGGRWTRRQFVGGLVVSGMMAAYSRLLPAYSRLDAAAEAVAGEVPHRGRGPVELDVAIREEIIDIAGGRATATTINNTVPGPLVELWEGEDAILRVTNHLDEDSSIHWHGILLPFEMDGVPGVTFPGIPPGETFEARFPVRQYGTYWYHSHSGLQEQTGPVGLGVQPVHQVRVRMRRNVGEITRTHAHVAPREAILHGRHQAGLGSTAQEIAYGALVEVVVVGLFLKFREDRVRILERPV